MNKFIIMVTFRNVEKYIFNCLQSIKEQKYKNFDVILCDDCSDDKTQDIIAKFKKINPKFFSDHIYSYFNTERKYKTQNLKEKLSEHKIKDNDIVLFVDGDDWLSYPNVLDILNNVYNTSDYMMTYGSYVDYPSLQKGKFSQQISSEIINRRMYKQHDWRTSHLISFRYKLWKNIPDEYFKDWNDEYLKSGADVACIFPMLEMAGNKIKYIDDILYVYNTENILNDHKVDANMQQSVDRWIRQKPKLDVLK